MSKILSGVFSVFIVRLTGGGSMIAPTAEDDCWVRYRRGDHWSSAGCAEMVPDNEHTQKPPLCKGRWPKGPEGLYLPISCNNYVQPLSLVSLDSSPCTGEPFSWQR